MSVQRALADIAQDGETVEFEQVDDDDDDDLDDEPVERPVAGSIMEALRARAQQLQAEQTIDLEIPGYHGQLVGRYHAVSLPRALSAAGEMNPILPKWTMAADSLARAIDALYYRDETGELAPLYPEPVRFDEELAEMFGLRPAELSARGVLVALCGGGELGESRVWTHYMAYQGWLMAGGDEDSPLAQEVAEAALGE